MEEEVVTRMKGREEEEVNKTFGSRMLLLKELSAWKRK